MTGAKETGRRANVNQSPPASSQTQGRRTNFGFEALCLNVGDLYDVDSEEEDVIPKIQEMLREKADQPGLNENSATAVAVSQLLLPVMRVTMGTVEKRLYTTETAVNKMRAAVRLNAYENDKLQQYTRRENVRMSGLAKVDGENSKLKIIELGDEMGLSITERDINVHVNINKDLTPLRSKLLQYAKRQDGVDSAYTREGKVICHIQVPRL